MKYNLIDLFAGCGGLLDGFMQTNKFDPIASVEWEKDPLDNLKNRLKTKWNIDNLDEKCILMDIQETEKLFSGWKEEKKYGAHLGLDRLVNKFQNKVDIIIGGPPCQAYSIAGRARDEKNMKEDYRNFLFESYLKVVQRYKPKIFIFENVPGILSAKPGDKKVTELIYEEIEKIGFHISSDLKKFALLDLSEYGVPQIRKRVIILGLNKDYFKNPEEAIRYFYKEILNKYKEKNKKNLLEAIGDLDKLYPLEKENNKKSHTEGKGKIKNHSPRYHNKRDIEIFRELAQDIEQGINKYTTAEAMNKLYYERTGKTTNVHRYHVLKYDEPSTTIIAHLHKDGWRFIHPDSTQARSITVREAARLQSFDDDFEFISSQGANYKMIGNAVPPKFSFKLAEAIYEFLNIYKL